MESESHQHGNSFEALGIGTGCFYRTSITQIKDFSGTYDHRLRKFNWPRVNSLNLHGVDLAEHHIFSGPVPSRSQLCNNFAKPRINQNFRR